MSNREDEAAIDIFEYREDVRDLRHAFDQQNNREVERYVDLSKRQSTIATRQVQLATSVEKIENKLDTHTEQDHERFADMSRELAEIKSDVKHIRSETSGVRRLLLWVVVPAVSIIPRVLEGVDIETLKKLVEVVSVVITHMNI